LKPEVVEILRVACSRARRVWFLRDSVIIVGYFLPLRNGHEIIQSQNQTWQVQKKTCQVKTKVKIKFGRCPDLPGFVLTWQVRMLFDAERQGRHSQPEVGNEKYSIIYASALILEQSQNRSKRFVVTNITDTATELIGTPVNVIVKMSATAAINQVS